MGGKRSKKGARRSQTPLAKHKHVGSQLIAPFAVLPTMTPSSWLDQMLPEVLWAALIVSGLERRATLDAFRTVAHAIDDGNLTIPDGRVTHTNLAVGPDAVLRPLVRTLSSVPGVADILAPLALLPDLPGFEVWAEEISALPDASLGWTSLGRAVVTCLDHQSQEATDCRWMVVLAGVVAGKLNLGSRDRVREVLEYPNYGDMRAVRPTIRATEMALRHFEKGTLWPERFWLKCYEATECGPFLSYAPPEPELQVGLTSQQVELLASQTHAAYAESVKDTALDVRRDAVFGLAAYAVAILRELMRPALSTSIGGRSLLRTLTEIAVTLAYLVKKDDPQTWQQYRNYGVGQAKLAYLKQEDEESPSFVSVDALEALANEDRWQEFTSIELGHWDKKDLRKLAASSGTKDVYDRYYDWTSHHGHGHWGAVRETVFVLCANPLHRLHRVLAPSPIQLGDVLSDAAAVTDRIFDSVRAAYPAGMPIDALTSKSDLVNPGQADTEKSR